MKTTTRNKANGKTETPPMPASWAEQTASPEVKAALVQAREGQHQPQGIFTELELTAIRPGDNMRTHFDEAELIELSDSISKNGVVEPIIVRPDPKDARWFQIVAGERRYRASKIAGRKTIPTIVRRYSDAEADEVMFIENLQRQDLSPLEEARGYQRMIERHEWKAEDLAKRLGKSRSHVYSMLLLTRELPDGVLEAMKAGKLEASHVQRIAKLSSLAMRKKCWAEVKRRLEWNEKLSVRSLDDLIARDFMRELKSAPFSRKDALLCPAAGTCDDCPKLTGNNRDLYPEGRADVCTDPPCYDEKVKAWQQRMADKAAASGLTVLSAEESQKLYKGYDWLDYKARDQWVELDETCYQDDKRRSYRKLLGAEFKPTVAHDGHGNLKYLAPRAEVIKELAAQHGIKLSRSGNAVGGNGSSSTDRQQWQLRKLTAQRYLTRIALAAAPLAPKLHGEALELFRLTVQASVTDADAARMVCQVNEIKYDSNDVRGSLEASFAALDSRELFANLMILRVATSLHWWVNGGSSAIEKDSIVKFFEGAFYQIRLKDVEKEVTAEQKSAVKAKAAKQSKKPITKKVR